MTMRAMSVLRLIVLAVLIAGVVLGVVFLGDRLPQFLDSAGGMGPTGVLLIVLLYIATCVLMLPGWPLTLAVGAVFEVWVALPIVSAGATLGACAAFLVGRFIARDWISRRLAGRPKFAAVDRAVGDKGFTIVLLTRLSPIFPFNLQNYAYALTGVPFWKYALATWLGMLPGALMYVYIGAVFGQAARGEKTAAEWALYAIGLAASVLAAIIIARIARNALAGATERESA
ncbi:MAG: TVP38/TMEM64 family protein [Phycisphaerae bacterium]|jgi:uncharacterized membrane protein YdjX (TVP38/TMEM64 family)|nr:TVP38/TMEM64 family protein [Phycisphaerae bacterium]